MWLPASAGSRDLRCYGIPSCPRRTVARASEYAGNRQDCLEKREEKGRAIRSEAGDVPATSSWARLGSTCYLCDGPCRQREDECSTGSLGRLDPYRSAK